MTIDDQCQIIMPSAKIAPTDDQLSNGTSDTSLPPTVLDYADNGQIKRIGN